jgi:hypothetical protein
MQTHMGGGEMRGRILMTRPASHVADDQISDGPFFGYGFGASANVLAAIYSWS